jgi:hypothetical protein
MNPRLIQVFKKDQQEYLLNQYSQIPTVYTQHLRGIKIRWPVSIQKYREELIIK